MTRGMSPTPPALALEMDFPAAAQAIIDGKKVTRAGWQSEDCIFLFAGILHLRKTDGTLHKLIVSDGDMLAADWIIVREQ